MIDNAIFRFIPRRSPKVDTGITSHISSLLFQSDFQNFIKENLDRDLTVTIEHTVTKSEKSRMYKYLNGPLISSVMAAKRHYGDPKDKAECMLEMKCLFAKDIKTINGETHLIIMSQSDMTKQRLLTFIKDIIQHLEQEYQWEVPDSQEYMLKSFIDGN